MAAKESSSCFVIDYDEQGEKRVIQQTEEVVKHRCPTDGHAAFFYVEAGLSWRCRHCKQVHVVQWAEILQQYHATQQEKRIS